MICLNEEQQRKDAHDRQAITEHLRRQLRQGSKSLVGNKGYRRYLKVRSGSGFEIDEEKLPPEADPPPEEKQEARFDGLWVLRTNMDDERAETIARSYKRLWMVEDLIRTTKSIADWIIFMRSRPSSPGSDIGCAASSSAMPTRPFGRLE